MRHPILLQSKMWHEAVQILQLSQSTFTSSNVDTAEKLTKCEELYVPERQQITHRVD
jgi:hypothetical protein